MFSGLHSKRVLLLSSPIDALQVLVETRQDLSRPGVDTYEVWGISLLQEGLISFQAIVAAPLLDKRDKRNCFFFVITSLWTV